MGIHKFCIIFTALAVVSILANLGHASSIMAVGQDEGYSGSVMDKIISKWSPPPQLKREYKLKLRIGLDGEGQVLECNAVKPSGLQALDASACAAVRAGAPFGPPPYGMPADIYLSFWTGGPQNRIPEEKGVDGSSLAAESMAAEARASAASARAKVMAEQAAQSSGKKLPEKIKSKNKSSQGIAKKQPDEPKTQLEPKMEIAQKEPSSSHAPMSAKAAGENDAANKSAMIQEKVHNEKTVDTKAISIKDDKEKKSTSGSSEASPLMAQDKYGDEYRKYLSGVVWNLRNAMYVPVEAAPGTYYPTIQINFNKSGKIVSSSVIKSSGSDIVDKYAQMGIKRAGRISPPPAGLGDTLDLTFTMVRK